MLGELFGVDISKFEEDVASLKTMGATSAEKDGGFFSPDSRCRFDEGSSSYTQKRPDNLRVREGSSQIDRLWRKTITREQNSLPERCAYHHQTA